MWALAFSPDDTVKCIGLVCAFFAPVWLLIWKVCARWDAQTHTHRRTRTDAHAQTRTSPPPPRPLQLGSQFVLRHADRITWGWFVPGVTTVLIDCLGQQQGVWRFPDAFLSGIAAGYLKLDIVLVYMARRS